MDFEDAFLSTSSIMPSIINGGARAKGTRLPCVLLQRSLGVAVPPVANHSYSKGDMVVHSLWPLQIIGMPIHT